MVKYYIYIVLFIFSTLEISAAITESVQLTCTEVLDDGSVILQWDNPSDLNDFKQFDIFHKDINNATFLLIESSTDVTLNNFHHLISDANNNQQLYYVVLISQSDSEFESNTIGTIFLQVESIYPDFNVADLYWTKISENLLPGTSGDYNIYWDYDGWSPIGSTQDTTFSIDIDVCNDSINFKIVYENTCPSVSNIKGAWFMDIDLPERIVFDSVSINENSEAVFGWQQSSPIGDVTAYIISKFINGGGWTDIDTINNTFYVDTSYNACTENYSYAIAAIDSCGNDGLASQEKSIRPILLYDIGFNVCAHQDTLRWEQYINVEVENYLVWRKDADAEFILIDSLPMPESDTLMMIYIDDDVNPGITYEYFIQAIFENGSSSSCKKTIANYTYKIPQDTYFVNADVTPENYISLALEVDTTVYSCLWEIYRINPLTNDNVIVKTFRRSEIDSRLIEFDNTEVYPQTTSYEYYAKVFDSCSIQRRPSNHLKTIFLEGSKPDEETNHLSWNAFEGWETEVEKYYIYRSSGTETTFVLIDSVNSPPLQYDDLISTEQANEGIFYYWVEAKQIAGIEYNYEEYSASNIVSLVFESSVYFPNAFRPGSTNIENNEFKPIFNYFSGSNYLFQIFNRWGQMVFETTDTEEGWNGLIEGQHQKSGLYVYRLSYKNIYGLDVDKKGTVMLLQ